MSDQTPRVPELWWSPSTGALHANRLASEKYLQLNSTWRRDLPADAVKLGDVEALRAELNRLSIEVIAVTSTLETVEAERDQLQARIDAVSEVLGHTSWADFDNPVRAALQGDQEASRG